MPNIDNTLLSRTDATDFKQATPSKQPPRFLLLYDLVRGSVRERSYSRFLAMEAARLLTAFGGEVKVYDPHGLPLPDDAPESHNKAR